MGNRVSNPPAKIDMEKQFSSMDANQQHYIKKLQQMNKDRVVNVKEMRKKGRWTGLSLGALAVSIYIYTLYAVKQEKFMEDFDKMPPDLESAQQQQQ